MSKTVEQRVLTYLQQIAPHKATNSDIAYNLRLKSHQQAFSATRALVKDKAIERRRLDNDWEFWVESTPSQVVELPKIEVAVVQEESAVILAASPPTLTKPVAESKPARQFEVLAQKVMSRHYGVPLQKSSLPNVHKVFDLVSADGQVVGDAKYYTLVRGEGRPSAKYSAVAEYVWMLEKINAQHRFLVFGNDIRVPDQWLTLYGNLVNGIDFFFLSSDGNLRQLQR